MDNVLKLVALIDKVAPMADQVNSAQRIQAASKIDSAIPAYGPSWTAFATQWIERNQSMSSMSAEQFRAYLAAKRAFAAEAKTADGTLLYPGL